jgi:hypothetical protein
VSLLTCSWTLRRNQLLVCFVSVAIISSLMLPMALLPEAAKTAAAMVPSSLPISAPPQAFSANNGSMGTSVPVAMIARAQDDSPAHSKTHFQC